METRGDVMYRGYLTPNDIARLWNLNIKTVYKHLKHMRDTGKWSDSMVKPKRAILVTADAFEDYLKWEAANSGNEQR